MSGPQWLDLARSYVGQREIPGPRHNPLIVRFWEAIKAPFRDDETPWCGAFVGGVLTKCNLPIVPGPASARSWLRLPRELDREALGAVVVFWRGSPRGSSGHVGFVAGLDQRGNLMVLGGNQGDMVSIKPFSRARVLGYRWPGRGVPLQERYTLPVIDSDGRLSTDEA